MNYLVTSFIEIARCISDDLLICDANTTIEELISDEFDCFDFETALCCFEATHRVSFKPRVWELNFTDFQQMTIEEFIDAFVDHTEQRDPLFITKRFLILKEIMFEMMHGCDCECEESPEEHKFTE